MAMFDTSCAAAQKSSLEINRLASAKQEEEMPFPVLLAIDPSMHNIGYACINLNLGESCRDIDSDAWRFGIVHPAGKARNGSELARQHKWEDAHRKLAKQLDGWKPTHLAIEWPAFYGSTKGRIAAMRGHTTDLAGMAAYLAGRFGVRSEFVALWTAQQWKGGVPKTATQAKFLRLFGAGAQFVLKHNSDDVIDAIMIADYWLSLYHREKFSWLRQRRANRR